jgi:peptidylprolyl isomerase
MKIKLSNKQGQFVLVSISEILDESIQVDANHPLAGKDLVFEIELMEIM